MRSWLLASQVETVVRESAPSVSVPDGGEPVCDLCLPIRGSPTWIDLSEDGSSTKKTTCVVYKDWAELESLAKQGCSSCRIFRATILYDHPLSNALEMLGLDKEDIKVDVKEDNGNITGLSIRYPYKETKTELGDFVVDPAAFNSGDFSRLIVPVSDHKPSESSSRALEEGRASSVGTVADNVSDKQSGTLSARIPEAPSERQDGRQSEDSENTLHDARGEPISSPIYRLFSAQWVDLELRPGDMGWLSVDEDSNSSTTSPGDCSSSNAIESHTPPENQTIDHIWLTIFKEESHSYDTMIQKCHTLEAQAMREKMAGVYGDYSGPNRWFLYEKINHLTISPTPLDALMIIKMIMWMGTCFSSHPRCGLPRQESRMPTRLVDLGDLQSPLEEARVVETNGVRVPYSCLSYCWGGDSRNHCRLIRSNLQQLQDAIFSQRVPQTVRDAMWISKAIGVRYIWIDALCIVQDDDLDWRAQAPWMGQFYGNAVVTIAATSSEHADMGMLRPRTVEQYELESCKIFNQVPDRPLPQTLRHFATAPINQRAWTMQELYLSRRIIHMTDACSAWECRTHKGIEFAPAYDASDMFPYSKTKETLISESCDAIYEAWHAFVTEYSSKLMTKKDDILVAVSSLAAIVGARKQDDYLAGLWRGNLLNDLLWQTDESRSRSKAYSAPSWSWASTHGSGRRSIQFLRSGSAESVVEINEVSVDYLDSNPRSKALSGRLRITGKIAEAKVNFDQCWAAHGGEGLQIAVEGFNQSAGDLTFDDSAMVTTNTFGERMRSNNTQLYCFALTKRVPKENTRSAEVGFLTGWIKALVLEKVEETAGDDTYRRVGFASLDSVLPGTDTFDRRETKCITIL